MDKKVSTSRIQYVLILLGSLTLTFRHSYMNIRKASNDEGENLISLKSSSCPILQIHKNYLFHPFPNASLTECKTKDLI